MAQEQKSLQRAPAQVRFSNGTTIDGLSGQGTARQRRPDRPGLRSASVPADLDTSPQFDRALEDLGIVEQETIVVDAFDVAAGATDTITLRPAIAAGDTAPRVVLYQDESGGISWHFANIAQPSQPAVARSGLRAAGAAAAKPGFVIPLRGGSARLAMSGGLPRRNLRGPITKVGRKIFKVLVLPILSPLLEDPVQWFGAKVEGRLRRNQIWQLTPQNYKAGPSEPFDQWSRLLDGPVLLVVHGILSSVEGMLAGLPRATMEEWSSRYAGRLVAFNHLTVSASPEDNARYLLEALRHALPERRVVFDVLCHSRGGIVSRTLSERATQLIGANAYNFRSVYFVATPNAGSPLGDADHMVDMIDVFTNSLTSLPDGPIAYSLEILLGLVTLVGHAGTVGLPGIAALGTRRSYVTDVLNASTEKTRAFYSAAAADYEPVAGRDNGLLIDRLANPALDRIFERDGARVANDLVVPQRGVYEPNGHPSFPIANPLVFGAGDGVWHTAFFSQPRTIDHINAHFDAVAQAAGAQAIALGVDRAAPAHAPADGDRSLFKSIGDSGDLAIGSSKARRGRLRSGTGSQPAAPSPATAPIERASLRGRPKSPPKAAAAATAPREETVARDPNIAFHERMESGQTARLQLRLDAPGRGPAPADRMTLSFDAGQEEIDLVAELSAPGFRIVGERRAHLRILRRRDPAAEEATFTLTALDPGAAPIERAIIATFWKGNECVGGVTHHTVVVPKGYTGPTTSAPDSKSAVKLSPRPREATDLILYVRRAAPGQDVFELSMRSQIPGEEYESRSFGSFDLGGRELRQYLSDALDPIFERFPGDEVAAEDFDATVRDWNGKFMTTLQDLGHQLWALLPQQFRIEYLRFATLQQPPRSVCVFSDELEFPWEIVRPSGSVDGRYRDLPPLGISHVFGRWRPGEGARPQPQARAITDMAILAPSAEESQLAWSAQEASELQSLIRVARRIKPVNRKTFDELLNGTSAQIVHFSGHGMVGPNADLNQLELEGGDLIPAQAFVGRRLGSEAQPLLYLNACTVGRGGKVLGRSGGFAGNCIDTGWSGVVAPYWPVYDSSAFDFCIAFYRKLKGGCAVGEALQELRIERQDDPTALSYAYFGDPFARWMLS
jgi:hypothetical protein